MPRIKTIEEALRWADAVLRSSGISEAGRESEEILGCILSTERTALLAQGQCLVSPKKYQSFKRLVKKRALGWPLAYLTGQQPFYGTDFLVDRSVLIPRPETEGLVDLALKFIPAKAILRIADIGTGSGCITITLSRYRPECKLYAVDRSPAALRIARINARRHRVSQRMTFTLGNLLSSLAKQPLDLIVANLPYLTPKEIANEPTIRHEPRLALDAGLNGLQPFIILFQQLKQRADQPKVILEIDPRRQRLINRLMKKVLPGRPIHWQADSFRRMRYLVIS